MRRFFAAIAFYSAIPLSAHTPYLVPQSFEPVLGGYVTLDSSFAEKFFVPEVAFNNGDFLILDPSGEIIEPDQEIELSTRVVIEHQLRDSGTYKFATGARYGLVFTIYEVDGVQTTARGDSQPIPEGAVITEQFQTLSWAETYVSKDAPDEAALKPVHSGLVLVPITHPNDLFAEEEFRFQVLFEGKPLVEAEALVFLAEDQFGKGSEDILLTTDEQGKASFVAAEQGVYLLQVRHRAPAPDGAPAPTYSHTTTLSLEAY
ncbi:MAG: DUF4198 domain-containing protein [Porticoccaceae bacterium]|jgi:uncharacterized GH25 family protein|nr:DUF4198 domain-containing protein [Porticoccaceae bacterium]